MLTCCLTVKLELSLKQKLVFTKYKQLYSIVYTDYIGLAQSMKLGLGLNCGLFLNSKHATHSIHSARTNQPIRKLITVLDPWSAWLHAST